VGRCERCESPGALTDGDTRGLADDDNDGVHVPGITYEHPCASELGDGAGGGEAGARARAGGAVGGEGGDGRGCRQKAYHSNPENTVFDAKCLISRKVDDPELT